MPVRGGLVAVIEAWREFLEDGTYAGSGSPAPTLNDALAARRLADGVGEDVIPDIGVFQTWWPERAASGRSPVVSIVPAAVNPEERNSRKREHDVDIFVLVASDDVSGGPAEVVQAGAYIVDEILGMLSRRTQGQEGNTLNHGGTAVAAMNRIENVVVVGQVTPDLVNNNFRAPAVEWVIPTRTRAGRDY